LDAAVMELSPLLQNASSVVLFLLPGGLWVAWCLGCVNWKKTWPVLADGAWVGVILLILIAALVWSKIEASSYILFDTLIIPNFWWQFSIVIVITLVALFCGWLQMVLRWTPMEVAVEPTDDHEPADAHGHEPLPSLVHGNGHGH
jgi:hypothetical protein